MSVISRSPSLKPAAGFGHTNAPGKSAAQSVELQPDAPTDYQALRAPQAAASARFIEWYGEYQPLVKSLVRKTFSNPSKAEEVCSEVWMKILKAEPKYDPSRSKETSFIMMVTKRHIIDTLRRAGVRSPIQSSGIEYDLGDTKALAMGETQGTREQFDKALARVAQLPELQQQVVTLTYLRGMTLSEVATVLGSPLGTVKSALSRALVRLRQGNLSEAA